MPRDSPASPGQPALHREKKVFQASASRHCVPGFDLSPAIDSIAACARNTWARGQFDRKEPLETAFEEDSAVLDGDISRRHARAAWPAMTDAAQFAAPCFLRAERQTFFPLRRSTRQAVFTIRVMLQSLPAAVDTAAKAARLHGSLASMSEEMLVYNGLAEAQGPLLRWLKAWRSLDPCLSA